MMSLQDRLLAMALLNEGKEEEHQQFIQATDVSTNPTHPEVHLGQPWINDLVEQTKDLQNNTSESESK